MKKVTVCITSFNRFELLCKTLDSFFKYNTYPIEKVIVIEDSGLIEMKNKIIDRYGEKIFLIFNNENIGQVKSIDKMYQLVESEYIFHSEDDYEFYKEGFIEDSLKILENFPNINQVWIRGKMLKKDQIDYYLESEIKEIDNLKFRMVKSPNSECWCGFSFNAGLRRTKDYKDMFPNGYSIYHNYENPFLSEVACNNHAIKFNYRACQLLTGYCDTIGEGQSTYK